MNVDRIVIADYDPEWVERYERERDALVELLAPHLVRIEHVGSTAVPGLAAKPIVDIAVQVRTLTVLADLVPRLRERDYRHGGEGGIPNRPFFRNPAEPIGRTNRRFNLHMTQPGSTDFRDHVAFRDYLRANPDAREQYAELKRAVAAKVVDDIMAYIDGKAAFVHRCLAEARGG